MGNLPSRGDEILTTMSNALGNLAAVETREPG